jgi:Putative quorum-sensing-regulated virulence factor
MAAIKMPFGKYRGKRLAKVPTDYLVWCRDSCSTVTDELRALIVQELARREDLPPAEEGAATTSRGPTMSPLGQMLAGNARMLFKNLAMKYHPDRGGSDVAMTALNEFHDQVQELLTRTFTMP